MGKADSGQLVVVSLVARRAIEELEPEEASAFEAALHAYGRKPGVRKRSGRDDMLGFGVNDAMVAITPVALMVTHDLVIYLWEETKKAIGTGASDKIQDAVRNLFKRGSESATAAPPAIPLDPSRLAAIRQRAISTAMACGLTTERAELLADALVGQLAVAPS